MKINPTTKQSAAARISGFFALLILLAPQLAAAEEMAGWVAAQETPFYLLTTIEGQARSFDLPSGGAVAVQILEAPRHGTVLVRGGAWTYSPAANYFGRDNFLMAAQGAAGNQTLFRFEMKVLPRYLPIAGKFEAGSAAAGLYDGWNHSFILCDAIVVLGEPLNCWRYPVDGLAESNYFPVLTSTKDGTELPALFDLENETLYFLSLRGSFFEVSERLVLPGMAGAWPLLGDWSGTGERELAMVFDDGRVFGLGEKSWTSWPELLTAQSGDGFRWPVRVPTVGGQDAVGWVHAESGSLGWLSCPAGSSCTSGTFKAFGRCDFRRPVGYARPETPVHFLQEGREGLELVPGDYFSGDISPQTIPIKFPDDPSSGGGG